jgi:hypothetical protein
LSKATLDSWKDGQSAAKDIKANASLSAQYMAVSGDVSVGYSIDTAFSAERFYSLFSYNQTLASCEFKQWGQDLDTANIAKAITKLDLKPFDPKNATIVSAYRALFGVLGSHIFVGCTYGSRLQMVSDLC